MIVHEEIDAFDGDERTQIEGYDAEVRQIRIVQHRKYQPDVEEYELGEHGVQIMCPCCFGEGRLEGTILCDGGHSCEHDVSAECSTCEGTGWCDLVIVQLQSGEYRFYFDGWGSQVEVKVTEAVLKKYLSYIDGWGGHLEDPNQQKLFEESP